MKKSWGLTQKILLGKKTIETRWYKHKAIPWNKVRAGETIYFKDSGSPVTVKALISKVEQYSDLNEAKTNELLKNYSEKDLGTIEIKKEIKEYIQGKRYAIIVHLKNPEKVEPFEIDKTGHGAMSAWLCIEDLESVKRLPS